MKVAGRILATMIAMVAILLIAVGADKGLNYLEKRKYEKECQELYAENHAEAEQLRTQIEELSQDEAAVETFLQEYAVADLEDEDEDVLQEFLTASSGDNARRYRCIQGINVTMHGNRSYHIALFLHQTPYSGSFIANHQTDRSCQI